MAHRIIGRDEELAKVDEFLGTEDGGFAALILEGEAGIGKTALWLEVVATATGRGYRTLTARPASSEATISFAGMSDLVEDVIDEVLRQLPEPQRHAVNAALLRESPKGHAPDYRAVAVGMLGVLRALAKTSPVLVAVDDVQWLDRASSAVLEFALRRLDTESVRLLGSLRSGEGQRGEFVSQLDAWRVHSLVLRPLTMGAIHHVVAEHLGVTLDRTALVRIYSASGGNPFFALEIARTIGREGQASFTRGTLAIPESLAELVRHRLTELPKPDRQVLLAISSLASPTVQGLIRAFPPSMRVGAILQRARGGSPRGR